MNVILTIATGPEAGRELPVGPGEVVTVGRTSRSNVALAQDTFLSGVHFALECGESGCRLLDQGSANGTFLNGIRVMEAALADGDQITAGQTVFSIHVAADATLGPEESPPGADSSAVSTAAPALLSVGAWRLASIPQGWEVLPGYGLRSARTGAFPSNIVATEDRLGKGCSFEQYYEAQINLLRQLLPAPLIESSDPPKIMGLQEKAALIIRYRTQDGLPALHYQVYGERDGSVGVVTLTTLESEFQAVLPDFQATLAGLLFAPKEALPPKPQG